MKRPAALWYRPHPPTRRSSSLIGCSAAALACDWPDRVGRAPPLGACAGRPAGYRAQAGAAAAREAAPAWRVRRVVPFWARARAVPAAAGDTGAVRADPVEVRETLRGWGTHPGAGSGARAGSSAAHPGGPARLAGRRADRAWPRCPEARGRPGAACRPFPPPLSPALRATEPSFGRLTPALAVPARLLSEVFV